MPGSCKGMYNFKIIHSLCFYKIEDSVLVNGATENTQILIEFPSKKTEPIIIIKYDKCYERGCTVNI